MIGTIADPEVTYLLDCRVCEVSVGHQYVLHLLDDLIEDIGVDRADFVLLLSDAAGYMTAAGKVLKDMYPQQKGWRIAVT